MNKNKISLVIAVILSILTVVLIFSALTMFFKQENGNLQTPEVVQETPRQQDEKQSEKPQISDSNEAKKSDENKPTVRTEEQEKSENLPSTGIEQSAPAELPRTGVSR